MLDLLVDEANPDVTDLQAHLDQVVSAALLVSLEIQVAKDNQDPKESLETVERQELPAPRDQLVSQEPPERSELKETEDQPDPLVNQDVLDNQESWEHPEKTDDQEDPDQLDQVERLELAEFKDPRDRRVPLELMAKEVCLERRENLVIMESKELLVCQVL